MAETLNIFKYATGFALIISFQFLIAERRQMKSLSKQEAVAIREKSQKDMANEGGKNTINVHQNNAAQSTETSQPVVTPGRNTLTDHQSLAGKQEMAPTLTTDTSSVSTLAKDQDEFRSLTPSRGVGRPSEPEDSVGEGIDSKVSTTKSSIYHFLTGQNDEFHPTHTGDSPGVGHVFQTKSAEPKE
ncbi:hypothetical protein K2173_006116 [Erythroxylum novogranatense]|uniref:Uncharacterized protein n=1 Tax=Erythroxylum novogranatense TaxID=1862640 RepID=A0AAV8TC58_9ROSI|nr:hypothetical protein K2173_006116 [Erythroxylum novogranatense]